MIISVFKEKKKNRDLTCGVVLLLKSHGRRNKVIEVLSHGDECGHTLWCREMDDIAVRFEHVDLLNCLNRLDIHLFQGRLKLLVICTSALVHFLDLSTRSTFASESPGKPLV